MKDSAEIVIIGAGIVGCSTAYHLDLLGHHDVLVVDQGPLFSTGGSTSHAPGLMFCTNGSRMLSHLARYSAELYRSLDLDGAPCYLPVGSIEVASTPARWRDLHRKFGLTQSWGIEAELLSPAEVRARHPLVDEAVIHGGLYVPGDGLAKAVRTCEAMARLAGAHGVEFQGGVEVTGIEVQQGRVCAVETSEGRIRCETVISAAGIWGPRIARMAGVSIPLMPCQHQYVKTDVIPELAGETREAVHPILRHQDASVYFRQHGDSYGIGNYRHTPRLVEPDTLRRPGDGPVMPSIMPYTARDFDTARQAMRALTPALARARLAEKFNGLMSFTPDSMPLVGPARDVAGFWSGEAVWVTHGGGVGKALAEWISTGTPEIDMHAADLNRFYEFAHAPAYIKRRAAQQYREVYDIVHPHQPPGPPRNLRVSPFHRRLQRLGAVFFEGAGWEQAQWFEANEPLVHTLHPPGRTDWAARHWSSIQGVEHLVTRNRVALYDLSPFAKFEISGRDSTAFLQYLTANDIDQRIGKVIYTAMLNARGGIMCDLTVTRLAADRYWVITGASTGQRDLAWIRGHLPNDGQVSIQDVTSQYCGIGLWGPLARHVLQAVTRQDCSNAAFPFYTAQRLTIGSLPVDGLRISYVGELGWELYTPAEYGAALWSTLWSAGKPLGMIAAGRGAVDSLRLEKGFRLWGSDIDAGTNPYEAGLGWAVKPGKGAFLGRDALVQIQESGVTRRLCCMTLEDPDGALLGNEPIFDEDGPVGYVTSTNYGYSIGRHIAYGYLPLRLAAAGTRVEIEYLGQRFGARVVAEPALSAAGTVPSFDHTPVAVSV